MIKHSLIPLKSISDSALLQELEQRGYRAFKEDSYKDVTPQKIVDLFYNQLGEKCGPFKDYAVVAAGDADLKAIQRYVAKAQRKGVSKADSMRYLHDSIKLFYKYYEDLGLHSQVTSITFLLGKGSWLFSKALALHKAEMLKYELSPAVREYKESLYDDLDDRFEELQQAVHKKYIGNLDG